MKLFDKLLRKEETPVFADNDIIALGDGEIIDVKTLSDPLFAQEVLGKTIVYKLKDKEICSPANGIIETIFPTGHAFTLRMKDGTGLLIHIGIDTVDLKGTCFKYYVKIGQEVKAGQKCVEVNWNTINDAGLDSSTMMIVAEPAKNTNYNFIQPTFISKYQIVNK